MIVVMETTATREQVNGIVARVKALGLGAHLSEGEERTIIGVVGSPLPPTLDDELEIHSGRRARRAHHQEVQAHRMGLPSPEDDDHGSRGRSSAATT